MTTPAIRPLTRGDPAPRAPTYAILIQRLRRLHLPPETLHYCQTYGQLQRLARLAYHRLAHRYHPDHRTLRLRTEASPGRPLTGGTFQLIAKTYQWLCAFPPAMCLPEPPTATPLALLYPTPPIAEHDLPFALQRREVPLGWGWQEWH